MSIASPAPLDPSHIVELVDVAPVGKPNIDVAVAPPASSGLEDTAAGTLPSV